MAYWYATDMASSVSENIGLTICYHADRNRIWVLPHMRLISEGTAINILGDKYQTLF